MESQSSLAHCFGVFNGLNPRAGSRLLKARERCTATTNTDHDGCYATAWPPREDKLLEHFSSGCRLASMFAVGVHVDAVRGRIPCTSSPHPSYPPPPTRVEWANTHPTNQAWRHCATRAKAVNAAVRGARDGAGSPPTSCIASERSTAIGFPQRL